MFAVTTFNFLIPQALDLTLLEELRLQAQNYLGSLLFETQAAQFGNIMNAKMEIEKQMAIQEQQPVQKGRGGNNIAQNIKKSFLSLLKRKISAQLYEEMNVRFFKQYNLKSQKENLILFFLFLEVLYHQQKIERRAIRELISAMKDKIKKYIYNSTIRIQREEWRKQFHEKNRAELEKFLNLDLDFGKQRKFQDMIQEISLFYLRKKSELAKASIKIKRIIDYYPCLQNIFQDLQRPQQRQQSQKQQNIKM